jgi:hypothetical protein
MTVLILLSGAAIVALVGLSFQIWGWSTEKQVNGTPCLPIGRCSLRGPHRRDRLFRSLRACSGSHCRGGDWSCLGDDREPAAIARLSTGVVDVIHFAA